MSDKFTPLTFGTLPLRESASTTASQSPTPAASVTVFRSLPGQAAEAVATADTCAKPAVTLQRNAAGVVTSVRVQCGCGQVTELNCVY